MSVELFPGKHLFVDDNRLEELSAAKRVLNQPQKHPDNPVMRPERPWEGKGAFTCANGFVARISDGIDLF